MPPLIINDFSAGWVPSDDPINGRKNGLLRMTGLDLEQNGAVRLTGGSLEINTFPTTANTIYSANFAGIKYRYAALQDGSIYRNGASISTGFTASKAAFVKAVDGVLIFYANKRIKDTGLAVTNLGVTQPTIYPVFQSLGTSTGLNLSGTYTWKTVWINRQASYIGRSKSSTSSPETTIAPDQVPTFSITNPNFAGVAPEVNEIWIYRRGGELDRYYKVAEIKQVAFGGAATFLWSDFTDDVDALTLGESLNEYLTTVKYTDTPDYILEALGQVNTRYIYFTQDQIIISERNSPDVYDIRNIIKISGSLGETFLFARQVGDNVILVGTSEDLYVLTGTFNDLPDGFIDVYFRSLGAKEKKPIGREAAVYSSNLIYMTAAGWAMYDYRSGDSKLLIAPNLDRLYNNEVCHGYQPVVLYSAGVLRYSCAVVNDKLYVSVQDKNGNLRVEVYDFVRAYWRLLSYRADMLAAEEDGTLIGFDYSTIKMVELDSKTVKTVGASFVDQSLEFLTVFFDGGTPRNRKDTQALKIQAKTDGGALLLEVYTDGNTTSYVKQFTFASASLTEFTFDASDIIAKSYQFRIYGASAEFLLTNISVTYELHPEPLTSLILRPGNLGSNSRKYLPNHPMVIDTLGNVVNLNIIGDDTNLLSKAIQTTRKQSVDNFQQSFTPAKDFEYRLTAAAGEFEFYELLRSSFMEVFPEQLNYYKSPVVNFGSQGEKIMVVWPFTIDTLGNQVTFTAFANNVSIHTPEAFIHAFKKAIRFGFVLSGGLQGIDFHFTLVGGPFELWEVGKPEIVRAYPVARKYDRIDGVEVERFAKISKVELRLLSDTTQVINVTIFTIVNHTVVSNVFSLSLQANVEDIYVLDVPKTVSSKLFRVDIGPASSEFRRIGARMLAALSDRDTELKWLAI